MKQREYPCIVMSESKSPTSTVYGLFMFKTESLFLALEYSEDYSELAHLGLKNSFEIKVPFYNEVQS